MSKAVKAGLTQAIESSFRGAGEALNGVTAYETGPADDPDDIWIPTDQEAEGVAEPAGRILARRVPELPGTGTDDAGDLIALAIPLGLYLARNGAEQVRRIMGVRRAQRLARDAAENATAQGQQ